MAEDQIKQATGRVEYLKAHLGMISAALAVIITIVTSAVGVNYHFARAEDVKELAKNQKESLEVMRQNNARSLIFQLEYYEDRIRQLEAEKNLLSKSNKKTTRDYDAEIRDTRLKKEFVKQQVIGDSKK